MTGEAPPPGRDAVPALTRRRFLATSALAASGLATLALADARWFELHHLEIVRRPLPIAALPGDLSGRRLIQLSDLHVGPMVDDGYIERTFERLRAEPADIVVYTGDFITMGRDTLDKLASIYSGAPRGSIATLGVLGNHDYGRRWSHPEIAARVAAAMGRLGIEILRNEVREVRGLQVAGFDDPWAGRFDPAPAMERLRLDRPHLVLSHNPDTADDPRLAPLRGWMLSGHTHGGQCRIPPFPPPLLPVSNRRYAAGEVSVGPGRSLYVSRGVGHLTPIRFCVRPEVTLFTLAGA